MFILQPMPVPMYVYLQMKEEPSCLEKLLMAFYFYMDCDTESLIQYQSDCDISFVVRYRPILCVLHCNTSDNRLFVC